VKSSAALRDDFDRIARAGENLPEGLGPHEAALLDRIPRGERALDVGCGTGAVARRLAQRCAHVDAIDLSPEMIRVARQRSAAHGNIDFQIADVRHWLGGQPPYDCITSFAVLHHMDARDVVPALAGALCPGGLLLLLDVTSRPGLRNLPLNGIAFLLSRLQRASSRELRAAFRAHGESETYLTPSEARTLYAELLPGAEVRAHLLWRYSVVWRKPATAPA
jgi:2-polyprenyl-3-methyl-5-hydroxy-6-metoxy-1,4-benzoquinol methylase